MKKLLLFITCCLLSSSAFAFNVGDRVVPSRTLTKPNGAVVNEGQIYEIHRLSSGGKPIIATPKTFLINDTQLHHFELVSNYSKYQNLVEASSFASGILLFITFVRGFTFAPF